MIYILTWLAVSFKEKMYIFGDEDITFGSHYCTDVTIDSVDAWMED